MRVKSQLNFIQAVTNHKRFRRA